MSRDRSPSPNLPTLVYDDDCGFCTWCADFAGRHGAFHLVGFADLTDDQRARLPENWEDCAHLFVDGETYSCGKAIELALAWAFPSTKPLFGLARKLPGYERFRERAYHWAAERRALWGQVVSCDRVHSGR